MRPGKLPTRLVGRIPTRIRTKKGDINMRRKRQDSSKPGADLTDREKVGMEGALNRCGELARQIEAELETKKMEEIRDVMALAELHASLERAAEVLRIQSPDDAQRGRRSA